jgi:hypothetical protein
MWSRVEPRTRLRSRRDHLPHRERDVLDSIVRLGATRSAQFADARFGDLEAEHALEVGDRDEQGPVRVAGPEDRVDLEHRVRGIARVDAGAVVDDPLEHRQRPQPHATMLADVDR